jgi:hypothetical protein
MQSGGELTTARLHHINNDNNIMAHAPQIKIPATYMRGGTSKGVFFRLQDLPEAARVPGRGARRAALARDRQPGSVRQADRRHGRRHVEHQQDRDYRQEQRLITMSTTFSVRSRSINRICRLERQLRQPLRRGGSVRDQQRTHRCASACRITAWPSCVSGRPTSARRSSRMCRSRSGAVQETGDFELDGVTFPAAEVQLEFMDPAADEDGADGAMFPTGNRRRRSEPFRASARSRSR